MNGWGVKPKAMNFLMNKHRNPVFWQQTEPEEWEFKGWSILNNSNGVDVQSANKHDQFKFIENKSLELDMDSKYITIGKGWPT